MLYLCCYRNWVLFESLGENMITRMSLYCVTKILAVPSWKKSRDLPRNKSRVVFAWFIAWFCTWSYLTECESESRFHVIYHAKLRNIEKLNDLCVTKISYFHVISYMNITWCHKDNLATRNLASTCFYSIVWMIPRHITNISDMRPK